MGGTLIPLEGIGWDAAHVPPRGYPRAMPPPPPPRGYSPTKDQPLKRLRRIEGRARGVGGMVSDARYCIDVLPQIPATRAARERVALGLIDEPARHCVMGAG